MLIIYASLPAGSLLLRATVDGYGTVVGPLELEAEERRRLPLVLRPR